MGKSINIDSDTNITPKKGVVRVANRDTYRQAEPMSKNTRLIIPCVFAQNLKILTLSRNGLCLSVGAPISLLGEIRGLALSLHNEGYQSRVAGGRDGAQSGRRQESEAGSRRARLMCKFEATPIPVLATMTSFRNLKVHMWLLFVSGGEINSASRSIYTNK